MEFLSHHCGGREKTQRELKIMAKAAKYEPLKLADDPALAELGETLKHFLQTQDERFMSATSCSIWTCS